eukprot:341356-Heterocapsa_arctica.AAC.1
MCVVDAFRLFTSLYHPQDMTVIVFNPQAQAQAQGVSSRSGTATVSHMCCLKWCTFGQHTRCKST